MPPSTRARAPSRPASPTSRSRSRARSTTRGSTPRARAGRVDEASVFVDDGISGAEFANRPGFLRLMNALKPRPPFQVLVMSEESRLGREAIETGVRAEAARDRPACACSSTSRTASGRSTRPTDKIMLSLTAFADELEREKARQRTYDAMLRKAKAGHVTGGRVFGYDNVEVLGADGKRSHVERRINEAEAAVVRRIFELCAAGAGLTRNRESAERRAARRRRGRNRAGRRPGRRRRSARCCYRTLYRGEIVWNQTRKRDSWGQRQAAARAGDRLDPRAGAAAADRLRRAVERGARAARRRRQARARTAACGRRPRTSRRRGICCPGSRGARRAAAGSRAHSRTHGGAGALLLRAARRIWKRGPEVCGNGLVARMDALDAEVLATLQDDILRPVSHRAGRVALALEELSPRRPDGSAREAGARAARRARGMRPARGGHRPRRCRSTRSLDGSGASGATSRRSERQLAAHAVARPTAGPGGLGAAAAGEARRLARAADRGTSRAAATCCARCWSDRCASRR